MSVSFQLDPLPPSQAAPQATGKLDAFMELYKKLALNLHRVVALFCTQGMADHPEPITDPQGSPPRNSKSPDLAGSPPHGAHGGPRRPSF